MLAGDLPLSVEKDGLDEEPSALGLLKDSSALGLLKDSPALDLLGSVDAIDNDDKLGREADDDAGESKKLLEPLARLGRPEIEPDATLGRGLCPPLPLAMLGLVLRLPDRVDWLATLGLGLYPSVLVQLGRALTSFASAIPEPGIEPASGQWPEPLLNTSETPMQSGCEYECSSRVRTSQRMCKMRREAPMPQAARVNLRSDRVES